MGAWHGFCSQPATRHNVNAGRAFAFNRLQSALSSHLCSPPQRFDCRAQNNVDRLGILPRCYEIRERSPLSLQIGDSMDGQSRKCGCPCTRRHKRRQIKLAIESVSASSAQDVAVLHAGAGAPFNGGPQTPTWRPHAEADGVKTAWVWPKIFPDVVCCHFATACTPTPSSSIAVAMHAHLMLCSCMNPLRLTYLKKEAHCHRAHVSHTGAARSCMLNANVSARMSCRFDPAGTVCHQFDYARRTNRLLT